MSAPKEAVAGVDALVHQVLEMMATVDEMQRKNYSIRYIHEVVTQCLDEIDTQVSEIRTGMEERENGNDVVFDRLFG